VFIEFILRWIYICLLLLILLPIRLKYNNEAYIKQVFVFCLLRMYNGTVHQLFIDFSKAYDSVRREVLYNILIEFGIPRKLVRLIKMSLN
jgi:hypothetical protein